MVVSVLLALFLIVRKKGFYALFEIGSYTEALAALGQGDDEKNKDERESKIGVDGSSFQEKH